MNKLFHIHDEKFNVNNYSYYYTIPIECIRYTANIDQNIQDINFNYLQTENIPAPWSCALMYVAFNSYYASLNPDERGTFAATQHNATFGQMLICSGNSGLEIKQQLGNSMY